ncbi:MAG: hypothetical protein DWQ07_17845 [Chloroflexi bacterium]|nr:MAG: hypothetical protein DWQ07_17845 [Chloroflexota bacterium]
MQTIKQERNSQLLNFMLFAVVLLVLIFPSTTFAKGLTIPIMDDPPPDGLFDPIVDVVKDYVVGILRFLVYLGGLVFLVSVVIAAARGSIGIAISNSMQVSQGVVMALMSVAAFIFMLMAIPTADSIINTLADRMIASAGLEEMHNLAADIPDGQLQGSSLDADHFLEIPELQTSITNIAISIIRAAIGLGTIAFIVGLFLGAFDTQLGNLLGNSMMSGRGIMRAISAVAAVVFLFISYPLASSIMRELVPRILTGISINLPNF